MASLMPILNVIILVNQLILIAALLYGLAVSIRYWHLGRTARLAAVGFGLGAAAMVVYPLLSLIFLAGFDLQGPAGVACLAATILSGWAAAATPFLVTIALRQLWRCGAADR